MKGSALVLALQDRFSVFWGVAGKGAGLCPAGAIPGQEGEK